MVLALFPQLPKAIVVIYLSVTHTRVIGALTPRMMWGGALMGAPTLQVFSLTFT